MKALIFAASLLLIGSVSAASNQHEMHMTPERLEEIRSKATTWTPYTWEEYPFKDVTKHDFKKRFGLKSYEHSKNSILSLLPKVLPKTTKKQSNKPKLESMPLSFNTETNWASCAFPVRDQGGCGSCWAFAATQMLQSRFCIATSGNIKVTLSPQETINCDYTNGGCNGGMISSSVHRLMTEGTVAESCQAYTSGTTGETG